MDTHFKTGHNYTAIGEVVTTATLRTDLRAMKRDAKRLRIIAIGLLCAVVGVAHGAHKPATLADYMRLSGPTPNERLSYGDSPYQFVELFQPRGPGHSRWWC